MSEVNTSLREGQIKFGYDFGTVSEVTHLFGMSATRLPFHNCFKIPGAENTLGCMLSEEGGEGWSNAREFGSKKDERGWREIITIRESNADLGHITAHVKQEIETPQTRVVFWRESREGVQWYKFYGVFKIDAKASLATLETDRPCCVYRKTADSFECQKVDVKMKEITDATFGKFVGSIFECRLFDDIRCSVPVKGTGKKETSFRARPGMRFKVKAVVGDLAVCEMDGQGSVAEYLLPRRDIELGYFDFSAHERCLESGVIAYGDFFTREEVLSTFGLKESKEGTAPEVYDLPGKGNVKVCLFDEDERGGWHHWIARNGTINDFCTNQDLAYEYFVSELENPSTRYVFYKMERNGLSLWKFFGVFELDQRTTNCLNHPPLAFMSWYNDGYRCYFKRVSKTLALNCATI